MHEAAASHPGNRHREAYAAMLAYADILAKSADMKLPTEHYADVLKVLAGEHAANRPVLQDLDPKTLARITVKHGDVGARIQQNFPLLAGKRYIVSAAVKNHGGDPEGFMNKVQTLYDALFDKTAGRYSPEMLAEAAYRNTTNTDKPDIEGILSGLKGRRPLRNLAAEQTAGRGWRETTLTTGKDPGASR